MAFIEGISDEEAEGRVAELYEAERASLGYVPNYTRVFSQRPAVYEAWQQLREAIREELDPRRYELATLAAARRLRSSYCSLAHGKVLADEFLPPETVRAAAIDHRSAGLEPVDVAVMDLADKVAGDANSVSQADIDRLRNLGLSDADIVDVVTAAAARCFFSKAVEALGAEPDSAFAELEPELREALTVGRPIADVR
jgi:uncharacterized peroxidase-related enzyme